LDSFSNQQLTKLQVLTTQNLLKTKAHTIIAVVITNRIKINHTLIHNDGRVGAKATKAA
jgi:hypothetical protein